MTTVKVTDIASSRATGVTMVRTIAYINGKEVNPNQAHANEWHGVPGLVPEPDFRSDWYGWGIRPWTEVPEAGKIFFNKRGHFRTAFLRRLKRAVRVRAAKANVRVEFTF